MEIVIVIVCLSAGLNLALWGTLHRKVDRLPGTLWKLVQRDRAADQKHALDVLQEAAASRVGGLVVGLKTYHDDLGVILQQQIAEAEVRARISERRSSEAGVALSTAVVLVRELRRLVNGDGDGALAPLRPAPTVAEGRATIALEPEAMDTTRKPDRPEPTSSDLPRAPVSLLASRPRPFDKTRASIPPRMR